MAGAGVALRGRRSVPVAPEAWRQHRGRDFQFWSREAQDYGTSMVSFWRRPSGLQTDRFSVSSRDRRKGLGASVLYLSGQHESHSWGSALMT